MRALDIAIAGCGPAGLATALLLHRDGHRITIFERFDAPKPVGSGLMIQPTGLAVLNVLGVGDDIRRKGATVERLFGQTSGSGRTVLDVRYAALGRRAGHGIGIHRASLFGILYDAARAAGILIATGRAVCETSVRNGRRDLGFDNGERSPPFDLVVDALGTRTSLAPPTGRSLSYGALWTNLDWPEDAGFDDAALEQRYHRASTMAGVLPIGTTPGRQARQAAFFWSIRADEFENWRKAGLDSWKADVRALWPDTAPLLDQIHDAEQMTFAHYAHRTLSRPAEPALIHIGDAWHSASPQLGQGANMALLDAWALATGLREAMDVQTGLEHAVAIRRRHVRLYQWLSAMFTPVYQSDSRILPILRDGLVGPLSGLWPATWIQAAMVSGLIGNPLKPLGLSTSPSAVLANEILSAT
jgi:2-polyprenyl-6-methoxyphenol hydroxylase-like FAD-dependent oxidoreductase